MQTWIAWVRRQLAGVGELAEIPPSRLITLLVVLTGVVAAGVGFLLNDANSQGAQASTAAQLATQQQVGQLRVDYETAESGFAAYLVRQAALDASAAAAWDAAIDPAHAPEWNAEEASQAHAASSAAAAVPDELGPNAATGPLTDPAFPNRFFLSRSQDAVAQRAAADLQNLLAAQWGALSGSYAVILTVLAIALFLLGTSFLLLGRNRLIFVVLATGILLGGSVWTGVASAGRPAPPKPAAASAYAAGMLALGTAEGDASTAEYQQAISDFSTAIRLRPDYAQAYERRGEAEIEEGGSAYGSITTLPAALRDASLADLRAAYNLGDQSESVLIDIAFDVYQQWIQSGSGALPHEASQLIGQAAQIDPQNPLVWGDTAFFDLASDDQSAAQAAFGNFLRDLTAGTGVSGSARTWNPLERAAIVAMSSAMLDLQESRAPAQHPGMARTLQDFESRLAAAAATATDAPPSTDAALAAVTVDERHISFSHVPSGYSLAFAAPVGWNPAQGGRDLSGEPLTMELFTRTAASQPWEGLVRTLITSKILPQFLTFDRGTGTYRTAIELGRGNGACLPPTQLRLDLYASGRRVLTAVDARTSGHDLVSRSRPELGVSVCAPRGWRLQEPPGYAGGSAALVTSPDGREGIVMLRTPLSSALLAEAATDMAKTSLAAATIQVDLSSNSFGLFGLPQVPFGASLSASQPRGTSSTFAGLTGANGVVLSAGSDTIIAGAGVSTTDGDIVVGAVYAPAGSPDIANADSLLQQVEASFVTFAPAG